MITKNEKRSSERISCISNFGLSFSSYFIDVCDSRTGEIIGRLEDISNKGLRLFSGKPIPTNRTFSLYIDFPDENKKTVTFEAKSIWCNHEVGSHFYHTGFKFTRMIQPDNGPFDSVVEELS